MKQLLKKYRQICEDLDWSIEEDPFGGPIGLWKETPAGEAFCIYASASTFAQDVRDNVRSFDQDKHVQELLNAEDDGLAGVLSVLELVEDAKEIQNMLDELADALESAT